MQRDVNHIEVLWEEETVHLGKAQDGPNHDGKSAKGSGERGQELKASWHGYNQGKNQDSNLESQDVLLKASKAS